MLGQEPPPIVETYVPPAKSNVPEWAAGTAAIIEAASQPAVQAYAINQRTKINQERIKAGLPPLPPIVRRGPQIPLQEKRGGLNIWTIIIGAIIVVLLFSGKKTG